MSELSKVEHGGLDRSRAGECVYCGERLDPKVYFCRACATPYKPLSSVVGHTRPEPLTRRDAMRARAKHAMPLFWTYLTTIVLVSLIAHVALDTSDTVAVFIADLAIGAVTIFFAVAHAATLRPLFARSGFTTSAAWISLALLPFCLLLNYGWHGLLESLLSLDSDDMISTLRGEGMSEAWLVFSIAVVPAITEEIAFRGLLQTWLTNAVGERRGWIYASALFAGIHFSLLSAPYLFVVGLLLGWSRNRTRSIYPPMLLHFLHNWVVVAWPGF